MVAKSVEFLFNEKGERTRVLMDIELYERMLEELEMAEDVQAYDKAMAQPSDPLPLDEAIQEIERMAQ